MISEAPHSGKVDANGKKEKSNNSFIDKSIGTPG
jgi:hypothetical protein